MSNTFDCAARESERPTYHFTAPRYWINDPNGLVHADGRYHLFYQHNPHGNSFGAPHWGHASSTDLVVWERHPVALEPDDLGAIFSGSAVVDHTGTAGFGRGAIVAVFTHHLDGLERQSLAASTDGGLTWRTYAGNPVLTPPDSVHDFRDPRVIRWEGARGAHWVMLLAVGAAVWIYTSDDLVTWTRASVFAGDPSTARVWECPDLIELVIDGSDERRWVLTVSVDTDVADDVADAARLNGTWYYVGDFDGAVFTTSRDGIRRADHGADFYAAQTWNDAPGGRSVWLGWMSNWLYAGEVPTTGWRGALTIPRELGLRTGDDGTVLTQRPVAELARWRSPQLAGREVELLPGAVNPLAAVRGTALDIGMSIDRGRSLGARLTLSVRVGGDERTDIVVDVSAGTLEFDRARGGSHPLHRIAGRRVIPLPTFGNEIDLRVLVDTTSVEVFAAGGSVVITELVLAEPSSDRVRLATSDATAVVTALHVDAIELPT